MDIPVSVTRSIDTGDDGDFLQVPMDAAAWTLDDYPALQQESGLTVFIPQESGNIEVILTKEALVDALLDISRMERESRAFEAMAQAVVDDGQPEEPEEPEDAECGPDCLCHASEPLAPADDPLPVIIAIYL